MKVKDIITENVGAMLAYKNLNALQANLLKRAANGTLDEDRLSPNARNELETLRSYGLVSDIIPDITPEGERALEMLSKHGLFGAKHKPSVPSKIDMPELSDELEPEYEIE